LLLAKVRISQFPRERNLVQNALIGVGSVIPVEFQLTSMIPADINFTLKSFAELGNKAGQTAICEPSL
jgi:hypothetical protein